MFLQAFTKYLRLTLVLPQSSTRREKFNFCFSRAFASISKIFTLAEALSTRHRGVMVITTAQLHSTKSELRLCAGSGPARGVSGIRYGEGIWQWSQLEIRLRAFRRSTIPQGQFIIHHQVIILWGFNPTILRRSVTHEATRIYHVYK